ncbi:30S ribosomal protein S18 [Peptococcaceae bacterium]|nr:30S ribosomal protein S18 [Peptococcaceae bacterium]
MRKDRRKGKKRNCSFCADKIAYIDFKDVERLKKYITDRGKIIPRRVSGNCAKHQRMLTSAIKKARIMALLPFTVE